VTADDSKSFEVFDGLGVKLSPGEESELEDRVYDGSVIRRSRGDIGRVIARPDSVATYIDNICESYENRFRGIKIALDCANGATSAIAGELFSILGCETKIINSEPNGTNINKACGSTDMKALKALVSAGGFDCGFAFDGDGDRCLAVDENGNIVDGDHEIAILACDLLRSGMLPESKDVTTVMTNYGFHEMARENSLTVHVSDVGDRNVLEDMLTSGAVLGGEQSGHIIYLERERTGDGLVTAMLLIDAMQRSGKRMSELASVMDTVPQLMQNVLVPNEKKAHIMRCEPVSKAIAAASGEG
jgi:phosphoglucosamine mutase